MVTPLNNISLMGNSQIKSLELDSLEQDDLRQLSMGGNRRGNEMPARLQGLVGRVPLEPCSSWCVASEESLLFFLEIAQLQLLFSDIHNCGHKREDRVHWIFRKYAPENVVEERIYEALHQHHMVK